MSNFLLDSEHDILIGRGSTRVDSKSDEYIIQLVKCRLLFIKETWELDPSLGLPWFTEILIKDEDSALYKGMISDTIKETEGIKQVGRIYTAVENRKLRIGFSATTVNNTQISLEI